jgi:hypothetical protein
MSQLTVSRLSRQCGILNISQPYRLPRPVRGQLYYRVVFLYFTGISVLNLHKMKLTCTYDANYREMSNLKSTCTKCSYLGLWHTSADVRKVLEALVGTVCRYLSVLSWLGVSESLSFQMTFQTWKEEKFGPWQVREIWRIHQNPQIVIGTSDGQVLCRLEETSCFGPITKTFVPTAILPFSSLLPYHRFFKHL